MRDAAQVQRELHVLHDPERARHVTRRRDLAGVNLPIANRQRMQRPAVGLGDRAGGIGIKPTTEEKDHGNKSAGQ